MSSYDGGPCFPADNEAGMTRFDYLFAHAPEIPDWWPEIISKPAPTLDKSKLTGKQREWFNYYVDHQELPTDDPDVPAAEWEPVFEAMVADLKKRRAAYYVTRRKAELKRLVEWRTAYAAAALKLLDEE